MTIKELINELNQYPEDTTVCIMASYDDGFGCAGGEIQNVEKESNVDIVYLINYG